MSRWLPLLLLALSACSKGPDADLPAIGEARSVAAEWALVNQEANEGKLTGPYVATMRTNARQQLKSAASSLTQPKSPYGEEIRALLAQPPDAPPEALRAHTHKLRQIEDALESA